MQKSIKQIRDNHAENSSKNGPKIYVREEENNSVGDNDMKSLLIFSHYKKMWIVSQRKNCFLWIAREKTESKLVTYGFFLP